MRDVGPLFYRLCFCFSRYRYTATVFHIDTIHKHHIVYTQHNITHFLLHLDSYCFDRGVIVQPIGSDNHELFSCWHHRSFFAGQVGVGMYVHRSRYPSIQLLSQGLMKLGIEIIIAMSTITIYYNT